MSQYCVHNPISSQFKANWGTTIYSVRRDNQSSGDKMGTYTSYNYNLRAPATYRSDPYRGNSLSTAPSTNYVSANNFWNNKN